jgi:hypothetical protein
MRSHVSGRASTHFTSIHYPSVADINLDCASVIFSHEHHFPRELVFCSARSVEFRVAMSPGSRHRMAPWLPEPAFPLTHSSGEDDQYQQKQRGEPARASSSFARASRLSGRNHAPAADKLKSDCARFCIFI